MKPYLFFFIFLCCSVSLYAQNISLSQINSDADVVRFVQQQSKSPEWNNFYLSDGSEWKDFGNFSKEENAQIAQSVSNLSWQKVDINNDGATDLIVSGYLAHGAKDWSDVSFRVLVFLSKGNKNDYDEIDLLNDDMDNYPAYFKIIHPNNINLLQLVRFKFDDANTQALPLQTDTLQYNSFVNNFINYSETLYPSSVQRIEYSRQDDDAGSYHHIIIKNSNNSYSLEYSIKRANSDKEISHTLRIKKSLFQNIDSLVRSYNADENEAAADSGNPSNSPVTITVFYTDGTKKTIEDTGGTESFTLLAIYQILEDAMQVADDKMQNRRAFWSGLAAGVVEGLL